MISAGESMQLNMKDRGRDVWGEAIVGYIYCRCYHQGGAQHRLAGMKALGDDRAGRKWQLRTDKLEHKGYVSLHVDWKKVCW